MQQWQSITAEPMTTGEALTLFEPIEPIDDDTPAEQRAIRRINTPFDGLEINPVPTPRPLGKGKDKDQKRQYESTQLRSLGSI